MRILFLALIAWLLTGCGSKFSDVGSQTNWTPYIENNGTLEEVGFFKNQTAEQNGTHQTQNFAVIKTGAQSYQKIGDMQALAHKTNNIALNLDDGSQIDVGSKLGKERLRLAKRLKFYEFKKGRIETIVYSAQGMRSLCEAFLGGEMIQTRSVTNYYLMNGGFFAVALETKMLAQKGADITHRSFIYEIEDKEELESSQNFVANGGVNSLINNDIKKQGRLLFVLCSAKNTTQNF